MPAKEDDGKFASKERYDENTRKFLSRFIEVAKQIHDLDSKQAANFFVRGLINGSLVHERFIETSPEDMNEVRLKVKGIIRVEENRQRIPKNATIMVAQNNIVNGLRSIKNEEKAGRQAPMTQRKI